MAQRIVVIGGEGQLGRDLLGEAERYGTEAIGLGHTGIEIEDPASVEHALDALAPRIVINTAACQGAASYSADDQGAYFRVNALGAWNLARWCRRQGALLVHYSTDYVFGLDRRRSIPYHEDDAPGATNAYGASKLAGEQLVRATAPAHYVLRVASLYGFGGCRAKGNGNFVEMVLTRASRGEPLTIVTDQVMSPTSTRAIAAKTFELLQREAPFGLYHLAGRGACSWYEFANEIVRLAGLAADVAATSTPEEGADALFMRPRYTALENRALRRAGLSDLPDWREQLAWYLQERTALAG